MLAIRRCPMRKIHGYRSAKLEEQSWLPSIPTVRPKSPPIEYSLTVARRPRFLDYMVTITASPSSPPTHVLFCRTWMHGRAYNNEMWSGSMFHQQTSTQRGCLANRSVPFYSRVSVLLLLFYILTYITHMWYSSPMHRHTRVKSM